MVELKCWGKGEWINVVDRYILTPVDLYLPIAQAELCRQTFWVTAALLRKYFAGKLTIAEHLNMILAVWSVLDAQTS